jgi:hypothetical protein
VAYTEREKRYQGNAATCYAGPLKPQCPASDQGRLLKRNFDEEYLEQVRAYYVTEPDQKAQRVGRAALRWRKRLAWHEALSPPTALACEL